MPVSGVLLFVLCRRSREGSTKFACSEDLPACNPVWHSYAQGVYLRRCYRKKQNKRHAYWALVESYRTARGLRQRVVAYLGEMDEAGRIGVQQAAQATVPQPSLFEPVEPQWVEVDLKRVRVQWARQFGGVWLGYELLQRLGLIPLPVVVPRWTQPQEMAIRNLDALNDTVVVRKNKGEVLNKYPTRRGHDYRDVTPIRDFPKRLSDTASPSLVQASAERRSRPPDAKRRARRARG